MVESWWRVGGGVGGGVGEGDMVGGRWWRVKLLRGKVSDD